MLENMRKIGSIHTFEDAGFLSAMVRSSVVTVAVGAIGGLLWFSGLLPHALGVQGAAQASLPDAVTVARMISAWGGGPVFGFVLWLAGLALVCACAFVLHEAVHALLFKVFAPSGTSVTFGANWEMGMVYACAQGIVYTRRQYLAVAMAPSVVITAVLLACGAALGVPLCFYAAAVIHLSGCTGDWGYAMAIRRNPRITHCEDTVWGVQFYDARKDDLDERGTSR